MATHEEVPLWRARVDKETEFASLATSDLEKGKAM
jgi:hypothetical protein